VVGGAAPPQQNEKLHYRMSTKKIIFKNSLEGHFIEFWIFFFMYLG
jgi:hypothetical protein